MTLGRHTLFSAAIGHRGAADAPPATANPADTRRRVPSHAISGAVATFDGGSRGSPEDRRREERIGPAQNVMLLQS